MRNITILLLILTISNNIKSQDNTKYFSNGVEFIHFLNDSIIDYAIIGKHSGTLARLYRGRGIYKLNNESLLIESRYYDDIYYFKLETLTFFPNDDNAIIRFKESPYFNNSSLLTILLDANKTKIDQVIIPPGKEINMTINSKIEYIQLNYNNRSSEYKITEFRGKDIEVEYLDQSIISSGSEKYFIKRLNEQQINLIGPIVDNYDNLNRRRFISGFFSWPWRWRFRKQHWYDPRQRILNN